MHIGENKFVITTEPKTFYFDLPKVVGIILKYENYFIIKHNEPLAEHTIKKEIRQLLSKYNYENDIINMAKSKTNEPHKFFLHYSQRLDLKRSNKHVAHQNLSIYYTQKNTRQQCKNSKLKVIGSIWNDEFKLPDNSYLVTDIQYSFEYILKKHKTLITHLAIHIYINMINNGPVFR